MNKFRLGLTIVIVFIVANFTGYFIHAIWLKQDYMPVANLYRPEGQEKMAFIILAYVAFAIGSVWAYAHGVENKPWLGQGLRFGVVLWLILSVPWFFITYAVQPIPALLLAKQIIMEGFDKLLIGVIIAALYRAPRSVVVEN